MGQSLTIFYKKIDGVAALLHEPLWRTCGTTDAHRGDAGEPFGANLTGPLDQAGAGIHPQTLVEEHLAVAALAATDEEHQVVAGSKL